MLVDHPNDYHPCTDDERIVYDLQFRLEIRKIQDLLRIRSRRPEGNAFVTRVATLVVHINHNHSFLGMEKRS